MSHAGESGDIKESFVEEENKVNIEEVYLDCVKNEPNEEQLDFEEDSHMKRYRITLENENIFGEPSYQRKIEDDSDNLIGFLDNYVIMEDTMIKLEAIKEEDDGSFKNFYCSKCKGIYKGYCLKCSTLSLILNNNSGIVSLESELNDIPTDILEIRETSRGKGVFLLTTLPMNIIFGPFEGMLGIESPVGHSWKIFDNKLRNTKSGNWMKNIICAPNALLKNLDIFQIDGNLYFQTNREIMEGEELLVYYQDEELQQLHNSDECLYTPEKQEKLPKIFACTICCLGFSSNKCLVEHKRKWCQMEHCRIMKEFVLIECHYCKIWLAKWEHDQYHVAYCLEKHHRMCSTDYSDAVHRMDIDVEEMKYDCDAKDNLQFDVKDYKCFSGGNLNRETLAAECSNNQKIQNKIKRKNHKGVLNKHRGAIKPFTCDICMTKFTEKSSLKRHIEDKHIDNESVGGKDKKYLERSSQTNEQSHLKWHLNKHRGIKPFKCDMCMMKFTCKMTRRRHIKNIHTDSGSGKAYKCLECSFQTNYEGNFQRHLNKHRGIKFECNICMVQFTEKGGLKRHIKNKHTDGGSTSKDFKCAECCYQTNEQSDLKRHLNKHRGIKPFQCDICLVKFTQKGSLNKHTENKHTTNAKDYKCLECSYQTNDKYNFQTHLNKHRDIKPFECDICMVKFGQKGSLAKHIRKKHTNVASATKD